MKGLIKWFKYKRLLYKLNQAKLKEYEVKVYYSELNIYFDDLNIRSINKAITNKKDKWRRQ